MSQFDLGDTLAFPDFLADGGEEGAAMPGDHSSARLGVAPPQPPQLDLGDALGDEEAGSNVDQAEEQGESPQPVGQRQAAKYTRRGPELMAHARAAKSIKNKDAKIESLGERLAHTEGALDVITGILPGAASLVGRSGTGAIGRKTKNLTPKHFLLLVRAVFMTGKNMTNVGIKHKRLVCAAANYLLIRQTRAMELILHACWLRSQQGEASSSSAVTEGATHMAYVHLWDETQVRAKARRSPKFRGTNLGVSTETMSQRGSVRACLYNAASGACINYDETWLCKPAQVSGTAAPALFPAILKGMPRSFNLGDLEGVKKLAGSLTSVSLLPLCDRASGNVVILKHMALQVQKLRDEHGIKNVLILPDICGVHTHHRGKLCLKSLRRHTSRHFSIANLSRQEPILTRMIRRVEALVSQRVQRKTGPAPDNFVPLRAVVDVLFDFGAPHHRRGPKGEGYSQRHADLTTLATVVNGDLRGAWTHHCWNAGTRKPCCASQAECIEKTTTAVVNALFGRADAIPSESRWTSVLSNLKQTVLRKLVYNAGIASFDLVADMPERDARLDVDSEAVDGAFLYRVQQTRIGNVAEYYREEKTFHELAILVVLLEIFDGQLMYPMMGDPIGKGGNIAEQRQLDKLMDQDTSAIGRCMEDLLGALRSWQVGGPTRKPWLLLDALGANLDDNDFMLWTRSQVLRLSSSAFRRYELKYSAWPYRLRDLYAMPGATSNTMLANELLSADAAELDPYSLGLRALFPTIGLLTSAACRATVQADFGAHGYSTDVVERLHSDITHNITKRTGGKNFANVAREALLRQACALHVARGAIHPLSKDTAPQYEELAVPPLLGDMFNGLKDGTCLDSNMPAVSDASPPLVPAACEAVVVANVDASTAAIVPSDPQFGRAQFVRRSCEDSLLGGTEKSRASEAARTKVGLSPKVLELNKRLHAAKELKGRTLSQAELADVKARFETFWASLSDRTSYKDAYDDWRASRAVEQDRVAIVQPQWGGGCYCSPISSREMFNYHSRFGWPADAEVYDKDGRDSFVEAADPALFSDCGSVRLWSTSASPRNVSRQQVPSKEQFEVVEKGLAKVIEAHGREAADAGNVWGSRAGVATHNRASAAQIARASPRQQCVCQRCDLQSSMLPQRTLSACGGSSMALLSVLHIAPPHIGR